LDFLKLWNSKIKYGVEVTFNGMTSLLKFIKSTNQFKRH
jgi:hypothetical protein